MDDPKGSGNAPIEQPNTGNPPAAPEPPSQTQPDGNVTISQKDFDELKRKEAIYSDAQSRADRAERDARRFGKKRLEQPEFLKNDELIKAKQIITEKALSRKDYQELLATTPEIAKAIMRDPSMLLDVEEFADAQDLADHVFDYMDSRIASQSKSQESIPAPINPAPIPESANPPNSAQPSKTAQEVRAEELDKQNAGKPPVERIESKLRDRISFTP